MNRTIGPLGLDLIKSFEGFVPKAYMDPVGIPTIGYGATYYPDGRRVRMGDPPITEAEGSRLLEVMVARYAAAIDRYVSAPIAQEQFDALVSWAYNIGLENARKSTLLKKLNEGDYLGAADQFVRWNRAGGQVMRGLTRRRVAERDLFLSGELVQ